MMLLMGEIDRNDTENYMNINCCLGDFHDLEV